MNLTLQMLTVAAMVQPGPTFNPVAPPGAAPEMHEQIAIACERLTISDQSSAEEIHSMAACLQSGVGRPADPPRARELFARAGEMGFAQSRCALGNMLVSGEGGSVDVERGLALCRAAAAAGDRNAQTDYANYLLVGEHIQKDMVEARRWYTAAAEQGQPNAAITLGTIYWNGDGVERDRSEAAHWWRIAYDHGRRDAAMLLANEAMARLTEGIARPEDSDPAIVDEAILWHQRAAAQDGSAENRATATERLQALNALGAMLDR